MVLPDVDQLRTLLQAAGLGVAAAGAKARASGSATRSGGRGDDLEPGVPGLVMRGIDRSSPSV